MSRADGKAERDRIEAERAVREAIAAKQAAAQSATPRKPVETTAERHRRVAEKTREAFAELDETDPPKRNSVTDYSRTAPYREATTRSRAPSAARRSSSPANKSAPVRPVSGNTGSNAGRARTQAPTANGKKKNPKKKMSPLSIAVLVVCLCVFGFSAYKVADYFITVSKTQAAYRTMLGRTKDISGDLPDSNLIDNPLNHESGGDTDTKTEIKVVSVDDIDLDDIQYISSKYTGSNPDVKGWFYFPGPRSIYGLPINTALLQGSDDYYYLDHDIEGNPDSNGCVYMSSGVDPDLINNPNTIIYGHAKNAKAFAGLKYLNNAKRWYSDANNHFICIRTENYSSVWQIFSWYETVDGGDFDRLSTSDWVSYYNYLQDLNEIPSFKKFEFSERDRIITLVTCKGFSNGRVAVHAKLVKYAEISD